MARRFSILTRTLLQADTVAKALDLVMRATHAIVPDANLVSVTCAPDGRLHTPLETDPVASEFDELQNTFGEGPCLDAAGEDTADLGFLSVLSTALVADICPAP